MSGQTQQKVLSYPTFYTRVFSPTAQSIMVMLLGLQASEALSKRMVLRAVEDDIADRRRTHDRLHLPVHRTTRALLVFGLAPRGSSPGRDGVTTREDGLALIRESASLRPHMLISELGVPRRHDRGRVSEKELQNVKGAAALQPLHSKRVAAAMIPLGPHATQAPHDGHKVAGIACGVRAQATNACLDLGEELGAVVEGNATNLARLGAADKSTCLVGIS